MSHSHPVRFDADDLKLFAPPGTIDISLAALDLVLEFLRAANTRERSDWIVVFDWAHIGVKERPDEEVRELGWLLSYGASKRHEVPGQMIHRRNGVEFAVHIPVGVIARSKQRLIDVDPAAFFGVALR